MKSQLRKYLEKVDAILVSSWGNITYLTGYSGFSQTERECFLLITRNKQYLITDGRYAEAVAQQTKDFEIINFGASKFIAKDYRNILKNLREKTVGFEENNLTVSEFKKLKKHVKKIRSIDLSGLRAVKKNEEIKNIKKACKIGDAAFKYIIKQFKIGISEREIADRLETFINSKNADFSFKPIVAFGKNSSVPHHVSGQTKLRKNQIVLLDFGVKVNNYCSDMSRTFFFGRADEKFKRMHKAVLSAQTKAIELIESSIINHQSLIANQIDKVGRDFLIKQNFPTIPHSLGHGIGIEVHEKPSISKESKDEIREGMVFSVEPGIYISGFGGVRIEDLVLATKNGAKLITGAKRDLIEI